MKVDQASVAMCASHSFSCAYETSSETVTSFRTVFDNVAGLPAHAASDPAKREEEQEKLLLMFESLLARLLALISDQPGGAAVDPGALLKSTDSPVPNGGVIERTTTTTTYTSLHEAEATAFAATGRIKTADGRCLDFKLDFGLGREYTGSRESTEVSKAVLHDPLVINFAGQAAELSGRCFAFDLDGDGATEQVDGLGAASGYLAIDSNADGRINNGSELFGTKSGDGFADLARLDADGNHWLDSNDPAFAQLLIWQHDPRGVGQLAHLADEGIGALYLDSVETPFSITNSDNQLLAAIRSSSVYLREEGGVGTLQQVDLAV